MSKGALAELVLIAAVARNGVIGRGAELVWRDPIDAKHFRDTTMGAPVVMGRKTWDSLPARFRPLPGRPNWVVTRNRQWHGDGAQSAPSLQDAIRGAVNQGAARVFVIGGGELYAEALPLADTMCLTEVDAALAGDVTFPAWSREAFIEVSRVQHRDTQGQAFALVTYRRKPT